MDTENHVVRHIYSAPPACFDQWEVVLGINMRLIINANSHQSAKRIAIDYWAACSADPEQYRRAIEERIAKKWRGGVRARRLVRRSDASHVDQP